MRTEHSADPVDLASLVDDPNKGAAVPPDQIPALLSQFVLDFAYYSGWRRSEIRGLT